MLPKFIIFYKKIVRKPFLQIGLVKGGEGSACVRGLELGGGNGLRAVRLHVHVGASVESHEVVLQIASTKQGLKIRLNKVCKTEVWEPVPQAAKLLKSQISNNNFWNTRKMA